MKPGIYENLPFDEYLQIDAVNNTALGLMKKSPRHYHERTELERTNPLVLGSLVHCGRLEPLALAERYAVMPAFHLDEENETRDGEQSTSKGTKYYERKAAHFVEANKDKEIVEKSLYNKMMAIVTSLNKCPEAVDSLACSRIELTLVWEGECGLLCKARLDAVEPGDRITDLKSTADLAKFRNAIFSYGYHRQLAHYQAGWRVLAGEELPPWIAAVESRPPYCVQAAPLNSETLQEGRMQRHRLLMEINDCLIAQDWPGPESPESWCLPEWALNAEPVVLSVGGQKVTL